MSKVIVRVPNELGEAVELEVPVTTERTADLEPWPKKEAWVRFITLTASSDSKYFFGAFRDEKHVACKQDKNSKKYFVRPDFQRQDTCGMYDDNGNGEDIVLFVRGFGA